MSYVKYKRKGYLFFRWFWGDTVDKVLEQEREEAKMKIGAMVEKQVNLADLKRGDRVQLSPKPASIEKGTRAKVIGRYIKHDDTYITLTFEGKYNNIKLLYLIEDYTIDKCCNQI